MSEFYFIIDVVGRPHIIAKDHLVGIAPLKHNPANSVICTTSTDCMEAITVASHAVGQITVTHEVTEVIKLYQSHMALLREKK